MPVHHAAGIAALAAVVLIASAHGDPRRTTDARRHRSHHGAAAVPVAPVPNPIEIENALPGNSAGIAPTSATDGSIEGYASEMSALPGATLHFHVSTNPAAPYRVEIYRLGWYGGAGARLVGCVPGCTGFVQGETQPAATSDGSGPVRAAWSVTATFTLPASVVSGYYVVRFVRSGGGTSSTFVIVRALAPDTSAILVQVPVNTWQAYNGWGGQSLYELPGVASAAERVSFDRPYLPGGQNAFGWEYPFVLFAEQHGYDISYQTDLDTDADPASLVGHRLVISLGHDEYWTGGMRDAFAQALAQGENLAFIGANDVYWKARYEDGGQTLVVYKSPTDPDPTTDPSQITGMFRALRWPECTLVGIQHQGGELSWGSGDYTVDPGALSTPWMRGTGFKSGDTLRGLVSVEADTIPQWDNGASCGHALRVYFRRDAGGDELGNADAVSYTTGNGATVFAAGSLQLVWGLADPPPQSGQQHGLVDPRLQQFFVNMLDALSAR